MRRLLAALLVGVLMVPRLIAAQIVAPGARVRVSHPGEGTRLGTVVALTADTLVVRWTGSRDTAHMPLAQVTRLDVSRLASPGQSSVRSPDSGARRSGSAFRSTSAASPSSLRHAVAGGELV
jgi:hypothetical protein